MSQQRRDSCPSCEKKYAGAVGDDDDASRLPVILPCLCVFCKECALAEEAKAQQQEDKEEEKGESLEKGEKEKKKYTPTPCMKCQKPSTVPVAELKLDAALMRQIASSRGGGAYKAQCDVCEGDDATTFCNDCTKNRLLCDGCFASAHKSAKKKGHTATPIEEHLASGAAAHSAGTEPPPATCHIHADEARKVYCNDCDVLVCAMCGILHHKTHTLTPITDAVGVHRSAIEALVAQVVVSRTDAIAAANAVRIIRCKLEGNRDAALKLVEEEAARKRALLTTMLRDVNPQRDALKALIKSAHDEKYDALSAQVDALDDIESNSEIALQLVNATLATGTPAELLERKQTFVDGLTQFKVHKVALRRCRVPKIDVVLDTSFEEMAAGNLKMGTLDTERALQPELQKQLCAAVEEGNVESVRKLLVEDDADPSVPDDEYPTFPPVWLAAYEGHFDAVKLLLEHNANPNQGKADTGSAPVLIAAQEGHINVVKLLLEHKADPNQGMTDTGSTPAFIAAQNGHVDVVKLLLEHNAEPNQATTDDGSTPVFIATQEGHFDAVKLLLEHKADPNQATTDDGSTPVFIATQEGHFDAVKLLLEHKADPNHPVFMADADHWTALSMAVDEGHDAVADLLRQHGAV
eukprot:gene7076-biopygen14962